MDSMDIPGRGSKKKRNAQRCTKERRRGVKPWEDNTAYITLILSLHISSHTIRINHSYSFSFNDLYTFPQLVIYFYFYVTFLYVISIIPLWIHWHSLSEIALTFRPQFSKSGGANVNDIRAAMPYFFVDLEYYNEQRKKKTKYFFPS